MVVIICHGYDEVPHGGRYQIGMSGEVIHSIRDPLALEVRAFDVDLAYNAGLLRPLMRAAGLSLGDRVRFALGQSLRLPVLTTDRSWESCGLDVTVRLAR